MNLGSKWAWIINKRYWKRFYEIVSLNLFKITKNLFDSMHWVQDIQDFWHMLISLWNQNFVRKYFSIWIGTPGGLESSKNGDQGTVSRDFLHFFAEKIRPRPTMNREKTVSRIYSIAKFENQVSACQISSKIFLYIRTFSYF